MFRTIRENRLSRWAAIFLAVNAWVLLTSALRFWQADRSLTIWPEAGHVQPYHDPETREIVHYQVTDVSVSDVAKQTQWPDYTEILGLAALNVGMLAWLLRLSLTQKPRALVAPEPVAPPDRGGM